MGSWVPGDARYLSRRNAFAVAAAALAVPAAASCSGARTEDPLTPLAGRAHSDAALADAVARHHSGLATQAREISTDRRAHASALDREITRLRGPDQDRAAPPAPRPAGSRTAAQAQLARALREAHQEAQALVPGLPSYRTGMVGSIAACCAALQEVLS